MTDYTDRRGPFITTYTGRRFYPLDVRNGDIVAEDTAHHLASKCRFSGALRRPVSIAQHSYYVSLIAQAVNNDVRDAYQGLHHDDSEAYFFDIPSPFKRLPQLRDFLALDKELQHACYRTFGCWFDMSPAVEYADRVMLHFEALQENRALNYAIHGDAPVHEGFVDQLLKGWYPWPPTMAESMYLRAHRTLFKQLPNCPRCDSHGFSPVFLVIGHEDHPSEYCTHCCEVAHV